MQCFFFVLLLHTFFGLLLAIFDFSMIYDVPKMLLLALM